MPQAPTLPRRGRDFDIDLPAEAGTELAAALGDGLVPVARRLTEDELKMGAALGPLVRSPRQPKCLFSLDRLVRSTKQ